MAGHYLIFLLSAVLAAGFAVCAAALCRVRDVPGFFIACLVTGGAALVLITELLSIVHLWKPLPVLIMQVVTLAAVAVPARRHGDFSAVLRAIESPRLVTAQRLRAQPLLVLGLGLVAVAVFVELVLAVGVAPKTWDSMTYHLTRVIYWMQNSAALQYPDATQRQAAFPVGAEILQGWTMMFTRTDRLVNTIQWLAQLGVLSFAWAIARDLGFSRRQAAYPVIVIAAMPVVMAQASTSQNDLTAAFLIAATLLFLLRAVKDDAGAAVLAGVAGGLAFATKSSAGPLLVGVGLASLIAAWGNLRSLIRPGIVLIVSVLLLGSLVYGQNIVNRGSLSGSAAGDAVVVGSAKEIPNNVAQVGWQAVFSIPSNTGLWFGEYIEDAYSNTVGKVASSLSGTPEISYAINYWQVEDRVAPGLPMLLVLPALLIALIWPKSRESVAVAVASILAFVIVASMLRINPFLGRFTMTSAILAAPLTARFGAKLGLQIIAVALLVLTFMSVGIDTNGKSVFGSDSVLGTDRISQQTQIKTDEALVIMAVEAKVPKDGRLGFVGGEDSWEYPFAGEHFDRTLVKLSVFDLTPGVFDRYNLDAILVSSAQGPEEKIGKIAFRDNTHLLITPQ